MIDARVSKTLTGGGRALADDIVTHLAQLGEAYQGTVIIGTGDPMILRGSELAPQVILPLAWYQRPNPIGRDQLAHADAVVLLHNDEVGLIPGGVAGNALVVTAARGIGEGRFLRTANPYEVAAAAEVLSLHPALRDALPRVPSPTVSRLALVELALEATMEALVAAGRPGHEPASVTRR